MVQSDVPAVGHETIDEWELARLQCQHAVALIKGLPVRLPQGCDLCVEHVVLMYGYHAQAPSGAAEILRVGIHADRVVWQLAHQRMELVDECRIHVVGD